MSHDASNRTCRAPAEKAPVVLSRRGFLVGMGWLSLGHGCNKKAAPDESPVYRGPFGVSRAILGVTPSTEGLPLPKGIESKEISAQSLCNDENNVIKFVAPPKVRVMVYYPADHTSYSASAPIRMVTAGKQKFPVVLYGHARRLPVCPAAFPQVTDPALFNVFEDYTRVEFMQARVQPGPSGRPLGFT